MSTHIPHVQRTRSQGTTQHYTPHATLAAIGLKIRSLKLFDIIKEHVFIKQKTIRHSPVEKLHDASIVIPASAHGSYELDISLRSEVSLHPASDNHNTTSRQLHHLVVKLCILTTSRT